MTDEQQPTLNDALAKVVRTSSISSVTSDEMPTGAAIVASIGGVRGLIESILPSFVFLVIYLLTANLVLSSLVPVGVAVLFIVIRMMTKLPLTPAVTGAVGVGITAGLAILTGRAENNFVLGIVTNAVYLLAVLVSLVARRPLIGLIVALLMGPRAANWRSEPRRYRVLTLVTWFWAALFGIRLVVEVPLYLAGNVAGLAVAKLILGVPLYAVVLWVTWLLVRSVFPPEPVGVEGESPKVS